MKRFLLPLAPLVFAAAGMPLLLGQSSQVGFVDKLKQGEDKFEFKTEYSFDKDKIDAEADAIEDPAQRLCPNCCSPLPGGLDHIANGTGTRNAGYGSIRLRGAPLGAVLVRAFLFWGGVDLLSNLPPTQTINFEGQPVIGRLYGTTPEPCWTSTASLGAYIADVTNLVPAVIDGDYQVDGFPSNISNGRDPWQTPDIAVPLADGATLLVIYSHASIPTNFRVTISLGPTGYLGAPLIVPNAIPTSTGLVRFTRFGADGQIGSGVTPLAIGTGERTFVNGVQIAGPGSPANDSDWNGTDGVPLNQLWDTHTTDVTNVPLPVPNGYTVTYDNSFDCFYPLAHVMTSQ